MRSPASSAKARCTGCGSTRPAATGCGWNRGADLEFAVYGPANLTVALARSPYRGAAPARARPEPHALHPAGPPYLIHIFLKTGAARRHTPCTSTNSAVPASTTRSRCSPECRTRADDHRPAPLRGGSGDGVRGVRLLLVRHAVRREPRPAGSTSRRRRRSSRPKSTRRVAADHAQAPHEFKTLDEILPGPMPVVAQFQFARPLRGLILVRCRDRSFTTSKLTLLYERASAISTAGRRWPSRRQASLLLPLRWPPSRASQSCAGYRGHRRSARERLSGRQLRLSNRARDLRGVARTPQSAQRLTTFRATGPGRPRQRATGSPSERALPQAGPRSTAARASVRCPAGRRGPAGRR